MKPLILAILAIATAFPQAQTPLTIYQSAGSATGALRMQERRTNGQNYVGFQAPQSVAANISWVLPSADGSASQCLLTDGSGTLSFAACTSGSEVLVSDYDWSQTPADDLSVAGAKTINLAPCPLSVAGANTNHYVRISGGVGTAEQVLITGGTCTSGAASGTITVTTANTHTGAWMVGSASDGWQEAIYSVADGNTIRVRASDGTYNIYSDILDGTRNVTVDCDGPGVLLIPQANNVAVFNSSSASGIRIYRCSINNTGGFTGTRGVKTYNSTGSSFGSAFAGMAVAATAVCFDLQTVYSLYNFSYNSMINCSDTALFLSNVDAGDAGIGLIGPGNLFSDSVTANYGINWNGPGNLKVQGNSFNGFIEQIHLEPKMGTVDVTGTAVTWVSGNKFRASMAGGGFVAQHNIASSISSVTDDQNLVLASATNNCTGCSYYVNNTGQMQIMNNTLDSWTWTTHNIRAVGSIPFYNMQINGNFTSNPNTTTYVAAVSIEGVGFYFGSIKHNNFQTSYVVSEAAVSLTGGNYFDVSDNQIVGHLTGVTVGSGGVGHTVTDNHCTTGTTTNCVLSAAATTTVNHLDAVTYTQLAAFTVANGSHLYCSNCKATSGISATCATGGNGANASRINGAWKCEDGTYVSPWTVSGANIYYTGGNVGVGGAPSGTLHLSGGSGANELLINDAGNNTTVQLFAENGFGVVGTYTAHSFYVATDSNLRWVWNSAGMFYPQAHDNYDIGLTGTRVREVFSRYGNFWDYVTGDAHWYTKASNRAVYWKSELSSDGLNWYLKDSGPTTVLNIAASPTRSGIFLGHWYPGTDATYDLGVTGGYKWRDLAISRNATVGGTASFAGNTSITGGSSLLMDRATRGTNQKAYWTVAANPSTAGAWSTGTIPSGGQSVWTIDHNGTGHVLIDEAGLVSLSAGLTVAGNISTTGTDTATRYSATGSSPFRVNTTAFIDTSMNLVNIAGITATGNVSFSGTTFTLNSTITGDLIPTSSVTYVMGGASALWNNIHAETVTVYANLIPDASASANLGGSTKRWTKTWTADIDITGTVTPPSGTAFSGTKTVRASGGAADCTLTFSSGIMTGGTC